jgi:ribosomal protein S18 acetylase RimI-like enzyme
VAVARVQPHEWASLRDIRLRALADAPDAFGTTLAEAEARDDAWWQAWAEKCAMSEQQSMFLARDADDVIGLAGVFWDDEGEAPFWRVISMWVEPARRGQGVGRLLLDACTAYARGQSGDEIRLSVTDGNEQARGLYEHYGFVDTGESEPLRDGSSLTIRELRLRR